MRVVLSYIHYPMAIARYIDAALRRRSDVELFTVGPFTGSWIPWNGGMHLSQKYAIPPSIPLPVNGELPAVPIGWIEQQLPWQPDLWLQVDAGWYMRGRPEHGVNAFVGTDPHFFDYIEQHRWADVFFCMQDCYKKEGDEYLPYAYDPVWHKRFSPGTPLGGAHPLGGKPDHLPYSYDAVLLGLHYENRDRLVSALRAKGVNVLYDLGPVFEEARALYNQAPIALSWSSRDDLIARIFEGLGMARLVVTNRVPDLPKFFEEGKDLIAFSTLEEAVEKVMYYLANPEEGRVIAETGHQTVQPHTWDARVSQILKVVL